MYLYVREMCVSVHTYIYMHIYRYIKNLLFMTIVNFTGIYGLLLVTVSVGRASVEKLNFQVEVTSTCT